MLIVLSLVVLIIIGIFLVIKFSESYNIRILEFIGIMLVGFSSLLLVVSLIVILIVQGDKKIDYQKMLNRRVEIELKIDLLETQNGKDIDLSLFSDVYEMITDYNDTVISHKIHSKSLWLNWFYNDLIGELEYIEQIKLKEKE